VLQISAQKNQFSQNNTQQVLKQLISNKPQRSSRIFYFRKNEELSRSFCLQSTSKRWHKKYILLDSYISSHSAAQLSFNSSKNRSKTKNESQFCPLFLINALQGNPPSNNVPSYLQSKKKQQKENQLWIEFLLFGFKSFNMRLKLIIMVNIFESIGFKKFIKNRRIICFSVEIS
jgi:hypothetical protein